jgi:hypothetical protein
MRTDMAQIVGVIAFITCIIAVLMVLAGGGSDSPAQRPALPFEPLLHPLIHFFASIRSG